MPADRFWRIIRATHADDIDLEAHRVEAALVRMRPNRIEAFDRRFIDLSNALMTWDHLDAVGVALGGPAFEDDFVSVRDWIVGQGKATYVQFLRDPDSLATDPLIEDGENLEFAPDTAYRRLTHRHLLTGTNDPSVYGISPRGPHPATGPVALACRFPHLVTKYGAPTLRLARR
jgi:hypothetical protein